jgi:hypothetical protein
MVVRAEQQYSAAAKPGRRSTTSTRAIDRNAKFLSLLLCSYVVQHPCCRCRSPSQVKRTKIKLFACTSLHQRCGGSAEHRKCALVLTGCAEAGPVVKKHRRFSSLPSE